MVAMTLGQFVSRRRAALGLSQRELARQVHVSNSTIFRIENENNYTFSPNILRAVAKALHCDFNYLLSLNKQIDDEPEIRMIQRAAKKMSPTKG